MSQDVLHSSFFGVKSSLVINVSDTESRADKNDEDMDRTEPIMIPAAAIDSTQKVEESAVIELDPLNANPCMITLMKVIETMQVRKIYFIVLTR